VLWCSEVADFLVVKMDIPGLIKESLQIQFHGTFLLVVGERPIKPFDVVHESKNKLPNRHNGKFARLIDIPIAVSKQRIHHSYKNGVLKIKCKKKKDKGEGNTRVVVNFKHPDSNASPEKKEPTTDDALASKPPKEAPSQAAAPPSQELQTPQEGEVPPSRDKAPPTEGEPSQPT